MRIYQVTAIHMSRRRCVWCADVSLTISVCGFQKMTSKHKALVNPKWDRFWSELLHHPVHLLIYLTWWKSPIVVSKNPTDPHEEGLSFCLFLGCKMLPEILSHNFQTPFIKIFPSLIHPLEAMKKQEHTEETHLCIDPMEKNSNGQIFNIWTYFTL